MIAPDIWNRVSSGLVLSVPALEAEIASAEAELGIRLPMEYREFLQKTNGAEGAIGANEYISLWPVGRLKELNDAYEVDSYARGFLVVGSNGGGEAYAFDMLGDSCSISALPFVGLSREEARLIGKDFWAFLDNLWHA
ncbi:SMI1/KNR4 family protein [Dokdonella fugitiva]|uniref:SMI1/KNR4 family protein n=1 Tax=Dokdonella fugitiva TaxID=328517 RepID=UPI0010500ACD|nr:SMI1/KNR4 family protein [Dokdonella fugitiva]